jgi:hypothetical protein
MKAPGVFSGRVAAQMYYMLYNNPEEGATSFFLGERKLDVPGDRIPSPESRGVSETPSSPAVLARAVD